MMYFDLMDRQDENPVMPVRSVRNQYQMEYGYQGLPEYFEIPPDFDDDIEVGEWTELEPDPNSQCGAQNQIDPIIYFITTFVLVIGILFAFVGNVVVTGGALIVLGMILSLLLWGKLDNG